MVHSIAVAWNELLGAFSNMEQDRVYFFDRMTGEIFSVHTDLGDSFWEQMEQHQDRFLEIPYLDLATERKLMSEFLENQTDQELSLLMQHALSGSLPFARYSDILSFFPEAEQQLEEIRETFMSNRVKTWLEENNLFSFSTSLNVAN